MGLSEQESEVKQQDKSRRGERFLRYAALWGVLVLAVFSLAALGLLTFAQGLLETVASVPIWFLPAIIAFATVAFGLRCCRWLVLARSLHLPAKTTDLAQVYFGGFVMNLTPGRIGELWRAWVLKQGWRVSYGRGTALVFCDRFLDLKVLLIFAVSGFFLGGAFFWPAAVACGALFALVFLSVLPNWARLTLKTSWKMLGKPYPRLFAGLQGALKSVGTLLTGRTYLFALSLSLLAWSCEAVAVAVLVPAAFGHAIDPFAGAAAIGLANIAGVLTHLPAGIGGQEVTLGHFLHMAGLPLLVATVTVGCMRLGTLWYSVLLGLPFFLRLTHKYAKAER